MTIHEDGEFAGYRVVRKLGAGGMGQVWLVENPHLKRLEAMKVVAMSGSDPEFGRRFTAEAKTAASLDHPDIVTVYAYGVTGDLAWFTMKHLDGDDLVRARQLSPDEVATIVERVADAVDYANSRGVIHRDIKPANIIVSRDPDGRIARVTVLDFGIAKVVDGTNVTATNAFIGTLTYAPPETLTGGDAVPSSDQYALAATTFQLLTGRPPFVGDNPGALMMAHIAGPIPRAGDIVPALAPFDHVLGRGLAKSPDHRYPTSREFAAAFDSLAGGATPATGPAVGHHRLSKRTDAASSTRIRPNSPAADGLSVPSQDDGASARRRYALLGGALITCIAVIAGVILASGPNSESPAVSTPRITYKVIGTGTADVSYLTKGDDQSGRTEEKQVQLPWSKDFTLPAGKFATLAVMAQTGISPNPNSITCQVIIDGKIVKEQVQTTYGSCNIIEYADL